METDLAAVEQVTEEEPPPPATRELTALDESEAARVLAHAWRAEVGSAPSARTLAILWAHWAHETGRGRRMVGHNFGGLKGAGPNGASSSPGRAKGPISSASCCGSSALTRTSPRRRATTWRSFALGILERSAPPRTVTWSSSRTPSPRRAISRTSLLLAEGARATRARVPGAYAAGGGATRPRRELAAPTCVEDPALHFV